METKPKTEPVAPDLTSPLASLAECDEELELICGEIEKHGWSPRNTRLVDSWLDERLLVVKEEQNGS